LVRISLCLLRDRFGGDTFLLNNGKWYRIKSEFLAAVNESFRGLMNTHLTLPEYSHNDEESYNSAVAQAQPDAFCLMDQKFIRYPTARDQVEFCDLYTRQKLIIHVKRYRGSATLSHCFSQGLVSGQLFCSLAEFRRQVNLLLDAPFRFTNPDVRPSDGEFEVVFAIISKSTNPLKLPFFSRVNLKNAAHRLRAFGFRVSVLKIQGRN
jgi:uncharacterized protein (TIGR04141 family)